jgi:hypothetical protein
VSGAHGFDIIVGAAAICDDLSSWFMLRVGD